MASRTAVSASMFAAASLILAASATAGPDGDAKAPVEAEAPETLRIGDEAMDLSPEILWMRNMLVPEFKEDTVYVVYLWSPDSPNSMGSFPQLHGLDQKLREEGVVTISIALDLVPGGFEPHDVVRSRAEFMAHTVAEDVRCDPVEVAAKSVGLVQRPQAPGTALEGRRDQILDVRSHRDLVREEP